MDSLSLKKIQRLKSLISSNYPEESMTDFLIRIGAKNSYYSLKGNLEKSGYINNVVLENFLVHISDHLNVEEVRGILETNTEQEIKDNAERIERIEKALQELVELREKVKKQDEIIKNLQKQLSEGGANE